MAWRYVLDRNVAAIREFISTPEKEWTILVRMSLVFTRFLVVSLFLVDSLSHTLRRPGLLMFLQYGCFFLVPHHSSGIISYTVCYYPASVTVILRGAWPFFFRFHRPTVLWSYILRLNRCLYSVICSEIHGIVGVIFLTAHRSMYQNGRR